MSDETTDRELDNEDVTAEQAETADAAASDTDSPQGRPGHEGHSLKRELREGAAKVAGFAVEIGSILGQQGGDAVQAEKDMAAQETEDFLDRIDGEG